MRPPFYKSESFWIMVILLVFYAVLVLTNKLEVNENLIVGALAVALFGGAKIALKFLKPGGAIAAVAAAIAEEDKESEVEKETTGEEAKAAATVAAMEAVAEARRVDKPVVEAVKEETAKVEDGK